MHSIPTRILRLTGAALILCLLSSACVYRMNIQQGNYLDPNSVAQLKEGMTPSQVRYLLGTPMLPDAFNDDRWDYFYYMRRGREREPEKRHLIVWFEDDKVARIVKENVLEPLDVPVAPAPPVPKSPDSNGEERPAQMPTAPPPQQGPDPGG